MSTKKIVTWQTWWMIVGPKLPNKETIFNANSLIAPLDEVTFQSIKKLRSPLPSLEISSDSFVIHYPPRDEVQSRYRLQIDVKAGSDDEAVELAKNIANRLASSLTLAVACGSYHTELRKIRIAGDAKELTSYSELINFMPLAEPKEISPNEINKSLQIFNLIEKNSVIGNSYSHLLAGWTLQNTPGSRPLQRSILQHYVLCIEAIINGVMHSRRAEISDKIRMEERKFADEFAASLTERADKPDAIRKASSRLREISLLNMIPSIDETASIIDISDSDRNLFKELYRFRSSNLSHPGRTNAKNMHKWLHRDSNNAYCCLADRLAQSFFLAYCSYISNNDL